MDIYPNQVVLISDCWKFLKSGLTSALYMDVVSHSNYSGQLCQHCQRRRTALPASPAIFWKSGMQDGGGIRHVSCNSGYDNITPEIHIIPPCELYGYTQATHEIHLTYKNFILEAHVLRSPFGARWLERSLSIEGVTTTWQKRLNSEHASRI